MELCAGLGAWLRFSPFAPLPLKRFRLKFSELGDVCKCFKRLRPGVQCEGHLWMWPRSVPPTSLSCGPAELRVLRGAAFWVGLLVHLVETKALPSPKGGHGLLFGEVGSGLPEGAVLREGQAASGSAGGPGLQPPHCVQCWGLVASWAPPASRPGSEDRPCLLWVILVGNPTNQEGF